MLRAGPAPGVFPLASLKLALPLAPLPPRPYPRVAFKSSRIAARSAAQEDHQHRERKRKRLVVVFGLVLSYLDDVKFLVSQFCWSLTRAFYFSTRRLCVVEFFIQLFPCFPIFSRVGFLNTVLGRCGHLEHRGYSWYYVCRLSLTYAAPAIVREEGLDLRRLGAILSCGQISIGFSKAGRDELLGEGLPQNKEAIVPWPPPEFEAVKMYILSNLR